METAKESDFVHKLNKRLSEVQEEEERRSKHSSTASETDSAVLETCVSAAVVENVKKECFATLEAGNTVRLSVKMPEATNDQKGTVSKHKTNHTVDKKLVHEKTLTESIEEGLAESNIKTSKEPGSTVVPTSKNKAPDKVGHKNDENSNQIVKIQDTKEDVHNTCSQAKEIDSKQNTQLSKDITIKKKTSADDLANKDRTKETRRKSKTEIKQNVPETVKKIINPDNDAKTATADVKQHSISESKTTINNNNHHLKEKEEGGLSNKPPTTQQNAAPTQVPVLVGPLDEPSKVDSTSETTNRMVVDEQSSPPNETSKDVLENKLSALSETQMTDNIEVSCRSPEVLAILAKQLTTGLAKQMIEATSKITTDMVGASTNSLTLYNESTLELADIDYFVIYKSEDPVQVDGISFIARMELGTNAITKVIPISPVRAWISYSGGGVKLIDTEKESIINKIDIPDLDTIATATESVLFMSNIRSFSQIEKAHIMSEGCIETTATVKIPHSRIACFTMADSGKMLMACIEKRHSCCCIPGKSEIILQKFQLHGKRMKEYKPKINGQPTITAGFPIVMCENVNSDICIASYNSADHTCAVEVFDRRMERKFIYDGDKTLSPRFMCEDLCCDKEGNILMLDNSLKCVHIVNKTGELVKLIYTSKYQIENPKCINIDVTGRLWIGQGPPAQMILLEYSLDVE